MASREGSVADCSESSAVDSCWGQIDLLYTPRGSEVVFDGERQATFEEPYLDLALAARPGKRLGKADVYLLLGGSLNLLLSARRENVTGSVEDLTDDLRRVDVALLIGAGVALHLLPEEPDRSDSARSFSRSATIMACSTWMQ